MKEKVSVIIPVYQAKNHLRVCLESVLCQTYRNMEIILVDDGSDDGSQAICDRYAEKYRNVHCIHQKNKGVSYARNVGIEHARGEYILFVDSDDYIAPDYLKKAIEVMSNQEIDLYLCGYQNVRKCGKIKEDKKLPLVKEGIWKREGIRGIALKLFGTNVLHAIGTKVYRREIIVNRKIRFCENRKYYEDIYFCLSYLFFCRKIFVQNEVMYFYQRDIKSSLSKQYKNIDLESVYRTYKLLAQIIQIKSLDEEDKKTFYQLYYDRVNYSLEAVISVEGKYSKCLRQMYKQLATDKIYSNAVRSVNDSNYYEYFCLRHQLYFGAYLFRYIMK